MYVCIRQALPKEASISRSWMERCDAHNSHAACTRSIYEYTVLVSIQNSLGIVFAPVSEENYSNDLLKVDFEWNEEERDGGPKCFNSSRAPYALEESLQRTKLCFYTSLCRYVE